MQRYVDARDPEPDGRVPEARARDPTLPAAGAPHEAEAGRGRRAIVLKTAGGRS